MTRLARFPTPIAVRPDDLPVIAGAGLAGMMAALSLAPTPCLLLSASPLTREASSGWAQGGIAAAVGADDDVALQVADTLAAGDGLCDETAVRAIVGGGPRAIERLAGFGVRFDRDADGRPMLGLEAAHSRRRIVHARGDGTGAEIVRALADAVRATASITVVEGAVLTRLLVEDGAVAGAEIRVQGRPQTVRSRQVVIATGGVGGLFLDTTNPLGSTGSGLAVAARAGAALGDLEFIQFHPTALAVQSGAPPLALAGSAPMSLVSEAVRGEGATLIDETGARFMQSELAPRDVVSRAVWHHLAAGHSVFLDARTALGERFATRFPGINAACSSHGIEPASMPIPIRPAAHYHMGGIAVDAEGRSSLPGLWACGEAACTGLHGANRLASNSLLEAAVCGEAVAASLQRHPTGASARAVPLPAAGPAGAARDPMLQPVRQILSRDVGVLRDAAGLQRAVAALAPMAQASDAALLGLMIAQSALARQESRGGHFRTDHPARHELAVRRVWTAAQAFFGALCALPQQRRAS
ncbi:L-aspartate oxidase [Lichenicoccus sp.]|uniref:L-aspartate oxidase n=1 Tax=Lichenicoccus sp. TaxID=2781899 RepID=UPI003D123C90